ncbi:MAG TPA: hypothetical protein PKB03_05260 [Baekduia sp.]|nr:hypothetical protein [Baekduia sp.]
MNAVTGMTNAQVAFDAAAQRVTKAATDMSSLDVPDPNAPDLAESMVGMMSAQLAYTASAKVLTMQLEQQRALINVLA